MTDLERCLMEQADCAQRFRLDDPGAWQGLTDWVMEETYLRTETAPPAESEAQQ